MTVHKDELPKVPVAYIAIDALLHTSERDFVVNQDLLIALREKGLDHLYLQCETAEKAQAIRNCNLLSILERKGFIVEAVVLPADKCKDWQLGDGYQEKNRNFTLMLDKFETEKPLSEQYANLYTIFLDKKPAKVGSIFFIYTDSLGLHVVKNNPQPPIAYIPVTPAFASSGFNPYKEALNAGKLPGDEENILIINSHLFKISDNINQPDFTIEINNLKNALLTYEGDNWIEIEAFVKRIQQRCDKLGAEELQTLRDGFILPRATNARYQREYNKFLELCLRVPKNTPLWATLRQTEIAYAKITSDYKKNENPDQYIKDLSGLTKCLKGVHILITDPVKKNLGDNIKYHRSNTEEVLGMNLPWAMLIGNSLVAILGLVLIATAIGIAIGTYGVASPLSATAFTLGANMVASGICLAVTISVGFGLFAGGSFLANKARRGELVDALEDVAESVVKVKQALPLGK